MTNPNSQTIVPLADESARIAWVDYSKGICILMVVLLHTHIEMSFRLGTSGWVEHIVAFAKPFRMPDFFLIAGLFLGRVVDRPWREYLDRKVWHFIYFYLLWVTIYFVLFSIKPTLIDHGGDWSSVLPTYLMIYIQPNSSLWFLHSLALFFLVVRCCRKIPWWLIWPVAAALQMSGIETGWTAVDQFCLRFVYFYSGYLWAGWAFRFADWSNEHWLRGVGYLAVWAVVNQYFVNRQWAGLPGVGLVLGYFGAMAVITAAVLLSRARFTDWLRYLGQYSIVLYLSDNFVQRILLKLKYDQLPVDIGSKTAALMVISVLGSLTMHAISRRVGLSFLYSRPSWSRLTSDADVNGTGKVR